MGLGAFGCDLKGGVWCGLEWRDYNLRSWLIVAMVFFIKVGLG